MLFTRDLLRYREEPGNLTEKQREAERRLGPTQIISVRIPEQSQSA